VSARYEGRTRRCAPTGLRLFARARLIAPLARPSMTILTLRNVSKAFGNSDNRSNYVVVPERDLTRRQPVRGFLIIGSSGCGKSTLLSIIGGLIPASGVNWVRVRAQARFPLRSWRRLRGRTSRLRRGVSPPDLPRTRSRPCVGRGRLLEGARRYRFSRSRIPATIPHMFPKARRNVQA
jgi:hypothetical protein